MKSKMKIIGILVFLIVPVCYTFGQQLPQFSQYMFNGLHINPAYAGYKSDGYIQSTYRSQWVGFAGAPTTFTLTSDFSLNEGMMGAGLIFINDRIGPTSTTSIKGAYSYRMQVGQSSFLSMGMNVGASQYMIDGELLKYNDYGDVNIPTGIEVMWTPNLDMGIFFHTDNFYAGVSSYNMIGKSSLIREDVSLGFHDLHFFVTMGGLVDISDNIRLKPSMLVKEVSGAPLNYDINLMLLFMDRLWLGTSYRSNTIQWNDNISGVSNRNSIAFIMEVFATPKLRLGYAYDENLNILQNMKTNSHELSIGYYLSHRSVIMKTPRWF